jgi:hypothetical protein
VTNHTKGGLKVVQLTSRCVFDAIQSNIHIAGDKDMIRESHKSGEDMAQFDEKNAASCVSSRMQHSFKHFSNKDGRSAKMAEQTNTAGRFRDRNDRHSQI